MGTQSCPAIRDGSTADPDTSLSSSPFIWSTPVTSLPQPCPHVSTGSVSVSPSKRCPHISPGLLSVSPSKRCPHQDLCRLCQVHWRVPLCTRRHYLRDGLQDFRLWEVVTRQGRGLSMARLLNKTTFK